MVSLKMPKANVPMVGNIGSLKGIGALILGIIVLLFAIWAARWVWNKVHTTATGAAPAGVFE